MGKMDKNILVTKKEDLDNLSYLLKYSNDYNTLYLSTKKNFFFSKRGPAETDESLVQIIPYAYIINPDKTHIIIYTRTLSGGEQRLHNKISVGVGGHIDEETHTSLPTDQYTVDIYSEALREVFEETRISKADIRSVSYKDTIYMTYPEVCKYHVGILLEVQVPLNIMMKSLSLENDGEIKASVIKLNKLYDIYQKNSETLKTNKESEIEDWSLLVIKSILTNYLEEE